LRWYGNACWVQKRLTVHEATLADIGVSTDQEGAGVGVNGRQPAHVLPYLLQVTQAGSLLLHDGAHATLHSSVWSTPHMHHITCIW